jgi:methylmalonyl-CoA mutase cobalamin-binding subunit
MRFTASIVAANWSNHEMTLGPGKYDDLCTYVVERTKIAERGGGVILIVIGGDKGTRFDVQADFATTLAIPDLLEEAAREIRRDMQQGKA